MRATRLLVLLHLVIVVCIPRTARAAPRGDELDLKLNNVKSIQVSGTLSAPAEVGLTLATLQDPFTAALASRGMRIDQENYDNSISIEVEVVKAKSQPVWVTNLSFHYSEPCASKRLKTILMCPLWEHFEGLYSFSSPTEAKAYVERTVERWAMVFAAEIPRHQ